jgi:hypothetical protein
MVIVNKTMRSEAFMSNDMIQSFEYSAGRIDVCYNPTRKSARPASFVSAAFFSL